MKASKSVRVALYCRVSTSDGRQDLGLQLDELRQVAKQRGWSVIGEYCDKISGAQDRRPGLDKLMADAARGEVDLVAVWKIDRLGRSLRHLVDTLETLRGYNVDFVSLRNPGLDTTSPSGRLMLHLVAAFAEFERSMIRERVRAGVNRAKKNGTRSGKPIGRPRRDIDTARVKRLRASGHSWSEISVLLEVPASTIRDACGPR